MSELVSAYPTAGGIYWWASKLGGPALGLVHRLVQPDRPGRGHRLGRLRLRHVHERDLRRVRLQPRSTASRRRLLLAGRSCSSWSSWPSTRWSTSSAATSWRVINNISVWWHVVGVAVIVADPDLRPRPAPVVRLRLHRAVQQLRLHATRHVLVLRAAARLPADAVHDHRLRRLARTSPRRPTARRRPRPRASGGRSSTRRSVGYILLLAIIFAATDVDAVNEDAAAARRRRRSSSSALDTGWAKLVLFISTVGQFFCGMTLHDQRLAHDATRSAATARSRAGGIWSQVNRRGSRSTPCIVVAVFALILTAAGAARATRTASRSRSTRSSRSR